MQQMLDVKKFLNYMPEVAQCERALRELNIAWRLIESTAKMLCPKEARSILASIKSTGEGFRKLEKQLVHSLVQESVTKSMQEIGFKSQFIIDILVRNLFERTADVGFLAMDEAIRDFILDAERKTSTLRPRLQAYTEIYSVYDEVIILDTQGNVLANLDGNNTIFESHDPLIEETLQSDTYVETFRHTDLRFSEKRSLVYSRKITHPKTGEAIGVLCLFFPVEVEMTGVFSGLRKPNDFSVMLLLDEAGYVIATSDQNHVALGCQIALALEGSYQVVAHAGREYFAKTSAPNGYQGYSGPCWYGHVMIPCEMTFREDEGDALSGYDGQMLSGVMSHAKTFCPPLHEISQQAEAINLALRRVVWNGKVMSAGEDNAFYQLKAILHEISQTGDETSLFFKDSIQALYAAVISSGLQTYRFVSLLLIDIMDRNLYERANDCRWWALAPALRNTLAKPTVANVDSQKMSEILQAINELYTVYSRIVVFDLSGKIVAASDLYGDHLDVIGRSMDEHFFRKVLTLNDSKTYHVSEFEPTWLYANRPTYLYSAAIFHPQETHRVIGGIAVVFDAAVEFKAMLHSALPESRGAFAAYLDNQGRVISTTEDEFATGDCIESAKMLLNNVNGESAARILEHQNAYTMVGHTTSFGYREYKKTDQYKNDVTSVVYVPIGEALYPANEAEYWKNYTHQPIQRILPREYVTFFIGGELFALPAESVIESVTPENIHPASTMKPLMSGLLNYKDNDDGSVSVVPVVDMNYLIYPNYKLSDTAKEIVLVKTEEFTLGLQVNGLFDVLEFGIEAIEQKPPMFQQASQYVSQLIKTDHQDNRMIQILDVNTILKTVKKSKNAEELASA